MKKFKVTMTFPDHHSAQMLRLINRSAFLINLESNNKLAPGVKTRQYFNGNPQVIHYAVGDRKERSFRLSLVKQQGYWSGTAVFTDATWPFFPKELIRDIQIKDIFIEEN